MTLLPVIDKALSGKKLSVSEGLLLYEKMPLAELGQLAEVRKHEVLEDPSVVTYILDRNINYSNVCNADCIFCAFYRKPGHEEGYVLSHETLFQKIEQTLAREGHQILLQGGHNPELNIEYYEDLFKAIKSRFDIKLHALSPPEIIHITEASQLDVTTVLKRLIDAGLDSIPGGGAEILVDRVRKRLARHKCSSAQWLNVMQKAHELGLRTTATMMFGHVEHLEERFVHMEALQNLQEKTHGFTSFICWTFQKANTPLKKGDFYVSPNEYLRILAVSRLMMPDIINSQVSFVTMGEETATLGLHFGGNDYGSVMMEENVVRAAGADNPMTESDIRRAIRGAGYTPRRRNMQYELLAEPSPPQTETKAVLTSHA